jgi:light-regulated signal transduction histidine kinase (bacteriophytochrome)
MANKNLLRANDSLKKFSSIAAHDLQEPLRKVEQYGDLLQMEYGERFEGDGVFYIQVMRDSARRMRALINALLNFSRAANRELTMQPIDMNEVMKQASIACAAAIEETGAQIQIDALPPLCGDAVLVTQVFQNLIINAIKYAKPGRRPMIHVGGGGSPHNVSIYVRDEGIGIDPEHQDIIFEAFTRLNTREKVKGAGIGLAFCRTVCERHGWRLDVKSERDKGSVFCVTATRQRANQAA